MGFSSRPRINRIVQQSNTELQVLLPTPLPALFSGSIAGAIGVGVAFPLDTVKTRAQVMATNRQWDSNNGEENEEQVFQLVDPLSSTVILSPPSKIRRTVPNGNSMVEVANYIFQTEGMGGFFSGVQTSMIGQAIIKAVVFAVNASMLDYLRTAHMFGDNANAQLLMAAASAGFITSFLAAPVDRIKVLMQAGNNTYEGREDAAFQAVIKTEGWKGLLGRGLFCTMLREVPAYSLYFGVYGYLMQSSELVNQLGPVTSSLLFGAIAGCACWIPIYPIDVVKTFIQNTEGGDVQNGEDLSLIQVASDLYNEHGVGVFWDGLSPRLLRQAVNHATTFALYEILLNDVFQKM